MNLDMIVNPHFDPSTQMWIWPDEFKQDDSFVWRDQESLAYDKRMQLISWYTNLNYNLLNR